MAGYMDFHRHLLQCFMSQRIMTEKIARKFFSNICSEYNVPSRVEDFHSCVAAINNKLKPLYMEIRHGKGEDDGKTYFALVNCSEDEPSKVATDYNANEIAFFKRILDLIVTSDDGYVSAMFLFNLGTELEQKMTASVSEALLLRLVEGKWLSEKNGEYSIGPRTIIELSMYLRKIYEEEVIDCKMCLCIVFKGQRCANCGIRLHYYCASKCFKDRAAESRKCPSCQAQWLHEIPMLANSMEGAELMDITY